MSLENDDEAELALGARGGGGGGSGGAGGGVPSSRDARLADVPPQLLFVHQGQTDSERQSTHEAGERERESRTLAPPGARGPWRSLGSARSHGHGAHRPRARASLSSPSPRPRSHSRARARADKEAHWHRQLPGVIISCAFDGINVWKPDVQTTT